MLNSEEDIMWRKGGLGFSDRTHFWPCCHDCGWVPDQGRGGSGDGVGGDDAGSILPLFINSFKSKAILITSTFSPFYCECKWKKGCRMHKTQSMASLIFAQSHYLSLPNAHSLKQCLQFIKQLLFERKLKTN